MPKPTEEIAALFEDAGVSDDPTTKHEALKDALDVLKEAWSAEDRKRVETVARNIADAARSGAWRIPIGESGVLDFVLSIIGAQGSGDDVVQTLRVVGNACVDCSENRSRVLASGQVPTLVGFLKVDKLITYALSVVNNVCIDNEDAQNQAYEAGFSKLVVDVIDSPRLAAVRGSLSLMLKSLELLETSKPASEPKHAMSVIAVRLLNYLSRDMAVLNFEDFTGACTVTLAYLSHTRFQQFLLDNRGFAPLLRAFMANLEREFVPGVDDEDKDEEEVAELLEQREANRVTFVKVIHEISELPEFFERCGPETTSFLVLVDFLLPGVHPQLQQAACLCLGNMCRTDEASTAVGADDRVRDRLMGLVEWGAQYLGVTVTSAPPAGGSGILSPSTTKTEKPTAEPLQVAQQALSCLKNLAIPATNKPRLGPLIDDTLPHYWTASSLFQQAMQATAVSLARLLVTNCPVNVKRMVVGGVDPSSHDIRTRVQLLIDLLPKLEAENVRTRMDVLRAVCAICRVLHTRSSLHWKHKEQEASEPDAEPFLPPWVGHPNDVEWVEETWLGNFHKYHAKGLAAALGSMLALGKHPVMRAEVLYVLGSIAAKFQGRVAKTAWLALEDSNANLAALADCVLGDGEGERVLSEAGLSVSATTATTTTANNDEELTVTDIIHTQRDTGIVRVELEDPSVLNQLPASVQQIFESMNDQIFYSMNGTPLVDPATLPKPTNAANNQHTQAQAAARLARVIRLDAFILACEVVRRFYGHMDPPKQTVYEAIITCGAPIVQQEQADRRL